MADVIASSRDHHLTLQLMPLLLTSFRLVLSPSAALGKGEGTTVATELCYPQTYTLQMRSVGAQFVRQNWTDASRVPRVALCSAHHSGVLQMWLALRLTTSSPLLLPLPPPPQDQGWFTCCLTDTDTSTRVHWTLY
jgi:hypothetical protein